MLPMIFSMGGTRIASMVLPGGGGSLRRWSARVAALAIALSLGFSQPLRSCAHEVDPYALPPDTELVDLGDYWDNLLYGAVRGARDEANFKLRQAQLIPLQSAREAYIKHCIAPDTVALAARCRLPSALMAIENLELKLLWQNSVQAKKGKLFGYFAAPWKSVYGRTQAIPDPRQLGRMSFMRCSLINVHGTYVGTDKVAHFVSMGYIGYCTYRRQIEYGVEPAKALRRTAALNGQGPLGETTILGGIPTGIYSNADMAADYLGLKFYLNLREPVKLEGKMVPPMLVYRGGQLWLREDVRPESGYFARFVSPHMDEVLNPNLYDATMRTAIRQGVQKHSQEILDRYAGDNPDKRTPEYFKRLVVEYAKYYGEDYGHSGQFEKLITVANTCFEEK